MLFLSLPIPHATPLPSTLTGGQASYGPAAPPLLTPPTQPGPEPEPRADATY